MMDNQYLDAKYMLKLGSKPMLEKCTILVHAEKNTNFSYHINGAITDKEMKEINQIESNFTIRDRISAIAAYGCTLQFQAVDGSVFHSNLQMTDSVMPEILASILKHYYLGNGSKISDLLNIIQEENPCNFDSNLGHDFYKYKIKNFMRDVALGMTPSSKWSGRFDATGGYIVVKEDGEILCYHIYNHNEFQDYLLNNVKLDTPSSTRYEFGTIYKEGNEYFLKLNLQLRFT